MWMPKTMFDLFRISKDTVDAQRQEVASLKMERDILKSTLLTTEANFKWIVTRINMLEVERAQLLEKAYGVKTVIPEIIRQPSTLPHDLNTTLFDDIGDDLAKSLGFPTYNV